MNKFVIFLKIILYPIYRVLFWYKVEGLENIPKNKGVIFCSNHISFLDPILWMIVLKHRTHFMAKDDLFKNPILKWLLPKLDVFAIKRGTADMQSLNTAVDIIKNNEVLGIFPEGTRSKNGEPGRAKSGVAFISDLAKCDVVPAAIYCKGSIKPFKKIHMIVGKPIPYEEIAFTDNDRKNLKRVSHLIMDNIVTLREGLKNGKN